MSIHNYIILVFLVGLLSCKEEVKNKITINAVEKNSSDLQVDHFNIWVENPKKAKELIVELGFTAVPDSLSQIHKGQGTAGRYFYFLNGYLELIFVHNQSELQENNHKNTALDFTERANFKINNASPFSIALKVKDYEVEKIPFEKIRYHQDWMEEKASIYAAKSSKTNLKEPSVFVVYPELVSDRFETLSDLKKIPEKDSIWRRFFMHPNGVKKITNIIIRSTDIDLKTATIKAINGIENISIESGTEHLMELYFDNHVQQKSFDLRPELPLIIHF